MQRADLEIEEAPPTIIVFWREVAADQAHFPEDIEYQETPPEGPLGSWNALSVPEDTWYAYRRDVGRLDRAIQAQHEAAKTQRASAQALEKVRLSSGLTPTSRLKTK